MISYEFILTSLIVVLIPGTGVIYSISTGITGSKKDSIAAAFGCTAGSVPHLLAGIIGLSAIFHMNAVVFQSIKAAGAVYLLYLGWGMIRNKGGLTINDSTKEKSKFKIIIKGILINLLNPKLTLFFFSFLPQFIVAGENGSVSQMIILGGIFMGLTFVIFILYGMLANYFKNWLINSTNANRRIQQSFGVIFIGLAAKLLFHND